MAVGQIPVPGEHLNGWQMDVHPTQNGAIGDAPWHGKTTRLLAPFLGSSLFRQSPKWGSGLVTQCVTYKWFLPWIAPRKPPGMVHRGVVRRPSLAVDLEKGGLKERENDTLWPDILHQLVDGLQSLSRYSWIQPNPTGAGFCAPIVCLYAFQSTLLKIASRGLKENQTDSRLIPS